MGKSWVKNAADEGQVKAAKRKERYKYREQDEEWKDILSTKSGKSRIWDLLSYCGVYQCSFTGNESTYFNEGRRDVGLKILSEIAEACPEALLEMMRENMKENENE